MLHLFHFFTLLDIFPLVQVEDSSFGTCDYFFSRLSTHQLYESKHVLPLCYLCNDRFLLPSVTKCLSKLVLTQQDKLQKRLKLRKLDDCKRDQTKLSLRYHCRGFIYKYKPMTKAVEPRMQDPIEIA